MFAPMAVAIAGGGIGAGPWVARRGTRLPTVVGCVVAAVGMVLARFEVGEGAHLSFALLALALAVAGLGFGVTVVPLTSAVLTHIPATRSGMAASATNTARQLGAVVGVASLGAIINAHLTSAVDTAFSDPTLAKLGGAKLKEQAVKVLETGGSNGSFDLRQLVKESFFAPFVRGFLNGLQLALLVATVLVLVAAAFAACVRDPSSSQSTATGSTADGSAPPSTASTGSA
jgi:MFS family permease